MGKNSGKDKANGDRTIALNKRARHEYHLEERFEAGMALQGWELKAIRAGRANVVADAHRTRKLLLHRREIDNLIGRVQRDGYTLIPTALYWKGSKVKAELALAKGKQAHDKRQASKDRDWARDKQRLMRAHNKNA